LLEGAHQFHRHRRGPAEPIFQRTEVTALRRLLHQRRIDRRNTTEEVDPVVLDQLPELSKDTFAAKARRRTDDHVCAARKRQQAGDQDSVDVEQGQTAEDGLPC
jgi:hypothetical protein